jgi:hypothetical protein
LSPCAICQLSGQPGAPVTNPIGLLTSRAEILSAATHRFGTIEGEEHALVPVCPEHVVDIYRGRLPGIRMAWRLSPGEHAPSTGGPAGRAAESAFPV